MVSKKHMKQTFLTIILIANIVAGIVIILKLTNSGPFSINTNGSAVVEQIKSLNKLETTSFTIEKIIDGGTRGNALNTILFGDRILLIAHGEVTGGFDLSKLHDSDITVEGSSIKITLPPPEILSSRLDNGKTRVYDRQLGLLTKGNKDLESDVREAAENSIRQAACDSHILDSASEHGKKQLTSLLKSLQFTTIQIVIPNGRCN